MRTLALILVLVAPCAQAQLATLCQQVTGAAAPTASPLDLVTNQVGYPALAFYLVSNDNYTTNGTPTLADTSPLGLNYHLTNLGAAGTWPTRQVGVAAINNKDSLLFDAADDRLRCLIFSAAKPMTAVGVFRSVATNANLHYFITATNTSGARQWWAISTAAKHQLYANANALTGDATVLTNVWIVWSMLLNPGATTSVIYTNAVTQKGTGADMGAINWAGLNMAARYDGAAEFASIDVAALVVYTNATYAVMSNAFYAFTNYYHISL